MSELLEKNYCVVGIDLAGSPSRPTGLCILKGRKIETELIYTNESILSVVEAAEPDLVAIDAPLSLPPGRKTINDRNDVHFRPCDLELKKKKIRFFPITLGPMRQLTERGISLKARLEEKSIQVIEIYPGGAQDIWNLPRAKKDSATLSRGLAGFGLTGFRDAISDHELDAITGALVGLLFLLGKAEVYGELSTGAIVMPKPGFILF